MLYLVEYSLIVTNTNEMDADYKPKYFVALVGTQNTACRTIPSTNIRMVDITSGIHVNLVITAANIIVNI